MPGNDIPMFEGENVTIYHQTGAKNPWQVVCEFDEPRERWLPKNRAIFAWIDHWFRSEDNEYSYYKCKLPLWYVIQLARDNPSVVKEAMDLEEAGEKQEMVTQFEKDVIENADEVIEMIEYLKEKCERNLERKGEL